jgi:hypothetical protein
MNTAEFIFYMLGIISVLEAVLCGFSQFEDKYNLHIYYDIFGFSLFIYTVLWSSIGVLFSDFMIHFIAILFLELAIPIGNYFLNYQEKLPIYITRKIVVLLLILWVMSKAVFQFLN